MIIEIIIFFATCIFTYYVFLPLEKIHTYVKDKIKDMLFRNYPLSAYYRHIIMEQSVYNVSAKIERLRKDINISLDFINNQNNYNNYKYDRELNSLEVNKRDLDFYKILIRYSKIRRLINILIITPIVLIYLGICVYFLSQFMEIKRIMMYLLMIFFVVKFFNQK